MRSQQAAAARLVLQARAWRSTARVRWRSGATPQVTRVGAMASTPSRHRAAREARSSRGRSVAQSSGKARPSPPLICRSIPRGLSQSPFQLSPGHGRIIAGMGPDLGDHGLRRSESSQCRSLRLVLTQGMRGSRTWVIRRMRAVWCGTMEVSPSLRRFACLADAFLVTVQSPMSPQVAVIMGSDSDLPTMEPAIERSCENWGLLWRCACCRPIAHRWRWWTLPSEARTRGIQCDCGRCRRRRSSCREWWRLSPPCR